MAWRVMAARFPGKCVECKRRIPADEQVEWERGTGIRHVGGCPPAPANLAERDQNVVVPRGRLMYARYDGRCKQCDQPIAAGALIDYVRGDGAYHPLGVACERPMELEPREEGDEVEPGVVVPNGRYTVALDGPQDRVYLRVRGWKGTQMLQVLPVGPERQMHRPYPNQKWVGFATLHGQDVLPWRNSDVSDRVLLGAQALTDAGAWQEYGEAYAVEFRRCYRCDKELRDPPSLTTGVGPDCRQELGIEEPTAEEVETWMAEHQAQLNEPVQEVLA